MVATKIKQMLSDNAGVSPVIGVILMVAVTVVLGAVIAGFVFGIGDSLGEPAPNAQIDFDYDADNDNLEILHDGGDAVTGDNTGLLSVTGDALDATSVENPADVWGDEMDDTAGDDELTAQPTSSHTSGDSFFNTADDADTGVDGNVESGQTVDLQWESPGGDQSSTLGTFEAP